MDEDEEGGGRGRDSTSTSEYHDGKNNGGIGMDLRANFAAEMSEQKVGTPGDEDRDASFDVHPSPATTTTVTNLFGWFG